jgi:hypothetical protein
LSFNQLSGFDTAKIIGENYSLLREGNKYYFFNIKEDPKEINPLTEENDVYIKMKKKLEEKSREIFKREGKINENIIRLIKSLGYIK